MRRPCANLPCTLSNLKIKQENDDGQTSAEPNVVEDCQVQMDDTVGYGDWLIQ